ncbi:MAG: hypothetical protein H0T73_12840 [Ardenticatenales bacterium]|nr:hypothetical protein [Ardenticatenales bacterium]
MMKSKRFLLLALCLVVLLFTGLLLPLRLANAQRPDQTPQRPWQQAIRAIEADHSKGRLSIDQAALYRFYALSNSRQLPARYQPSNHGSSPHQPPIDLRASPHDSMEPIGEMFAALFIDEAAWQPETRELIAGLMEEESLLAINSHTMISPTKRHFLIHWDSSGGPNTPPSCRSTLPRCDYVDVISETLEYAYDELVLSGHDMPEPSDFGLGKIDIEIVGDIAPCNFPFVPNNVAAFSPPGKIYFRADIDWDIEKLPASNVLPRNSLFLPTAVAHELISTNGIRWVFATQAAWAGQGLWNGTTTSSQVEKEMRG